MNENMNKYVNKISDILEEKIKIITSIEYHYDIDKLLSFMNSLSESEEEKVLEKTINDKLEEIKLLGVDCLIDKDDNSIDEVNEFFQNKEKDSTCATEGICVANDLVLKVLGKNGRKISLPINIEYIKDFCIGNIIEERYIRKTLIWVVLELSIIVFFMRAKHDLLNRCN